MGLFKRRKNSENTFQDTGAPGAISQDEPDQATLTKIDELKDRLQEVSTEEERIALLNELGSMQRSVGDPEAIKTFESSMAIREQYGPAYTALLALYNEQLQASARAKDGEGIQLWTTKLDELMALSKRVMRSNY